MSSPVGTSATPLDKVSHLGEGLIEKLHEAGITTVEALADMTPEQLEELPGVGPKTVEKIRIAVYNYLASLEAGSAPTEESTPEADAEIAATEASTEQAANEVASGVEASAEETAADPEKEQIAAAAEDPSAETEA